MKDLKEKIVIERIFDTVSAKVWRAWTDPEMIKKWWGPEGFYAPSIKIDLRPGGKYIFGMHGPKGSEFDKDMYSAGVYKEIIPMKKLVVTDYFSDENGNMIDPTMAGMNAEMPAELNAVVTFEDLGPDKARLTIAYETPESEAQFEEMKKSGMVEGWNSSLEKLAKLLESNRE